jgi:hypothetical protein
MKPSTKAAIYSAFIFPGAGLWVLGQKGRAAVFGVPALIAVMFIMVGTWGIARKIADELIKEILATGQINIDLWAILAQVRQAVTESPNLENAQWIFVASWIISIFSSYAVGKLQEQSQPSANP